MDGHNSPFRIGRIVAAAACVGMCAAVWANVAAGDSPPLKVAAVIDCWGMIDEGLYKSIIRRSEEAIAEGADTIFYDIQTYGGRVDSADDISKYLIHDVAPRAHTVAYISKEAISAGAMVSVSCQDIIMRTSTTIGASAPMAMGGTLEEVEREKIESFVRSVFSRAAEANDYPEALLKAMVSRQIEVWQIENLETGQKEFFETEFLPTDAERYDLDNKRLIVKNDEILTLTDAKAYEYGVARAVVDSMDEALAFLAERDGVAFDLPVRVYRPLWSEQMVRWINSPAVVSVLVMGILLGVYMELNTPGLGLPSLLAVICMVVLVGSRFLTGLANWLEIAILVIGIVLLLVEFIVLPGFGVAGFFGISFVLVGLFGMFIRTDPGELPWPKDPIAWQELFEGMMGVSIGFLAFLVVAFILTKYLDRLPFLQRFVLSVNLDRPVPQNEVSAGQLGQVSPGGFSVGQVGRAVSLLRPAGKARFDGKLADVVTHGEYLDSGTPVRIAEIHGNRIVVQIEQQDDESKMDGC